MQRVLIASDEDGKWYVRRIALVSTDALGDRVYTCDMHVDGPFDNPHAAADCASLFQSIETMKANGVSVDWERVKTRAGFSVVRVDKHGFVDDPGDPNEGSLLLNCEGFRADDARILVEVNDGGGSYRYLTAAEYAAEFEVYEND